MPSIFTRACALGLVLSAVTLPPCFADDAKAAPVKKHKAVFQVDESDSRKWELVLGNVHNLQKDFGKENVDIEIVVYGPGMDMLTLESTSAAHVADTLAQGVQVVACENTMRGRKLTKADLLDHVGVVPAGVGELVRRQEQGYAYLRP